MKKLYSFGIGIGTKNNQNEHLEFFYPQPLVWPKSSLINALVTVTNKSDDNQVISPTSEQLIALATSLDNNGEQEQANLARELSNIDNQSKKCVVVTALAIDSPPKTVAESYLKLHLLSHRLVKPHETDLTGIFGVLPNIAWTNQGPIDLNELPERQLAARLKGEYLLVDCVDKFPRMTDYVVPHGVRIADTARVRLGAYIGEGTTIMHEGFVNFNAGTLGTSMIEGRISAGVVVGEGSDLGGGCSTMGTLSGGGNIIISVGKECLIGANAGIGIPLGDRCIVEAGLYITAGSKVNLLDDSGEVVSKLKARELANKSDLLFRRNSLSGAIECKTNQSAVLLNAELHTNN